VNPIYEPGFENSFSNLIGAPAGIRTPNLLIRSCPVNLSF
jgi:hypothetical protein